MKVKLTYSLQGMDINRDEGLPVVFDTGDKTQFVLWRQEVEHQGRTVRQMCCDLIVETEPPVRAKETLLALLEHKLLLDDPIQEGLPYQTLSGDVVVDILGNITPKWMIPFSLLPKGTKPWIGQVTSRMQAQFTEFVKQLRWFQNTSGGHQPFGLVGKFWSLDGEIWTRFPRDTGGHVSQFRHIKVSASSRASLLHLASSGSVEPVSHDLIREAGELTFRSPRSALLIAFAALETCIKTQLVHLMPGAQSLIEKMPSPPIVTLLQEVIPKLLKRGGIEVEYLPLSEPAKKFLMKWVSQRNHVTHGVKHSVDPKGVGNFILFATDILYIFDYCNGHDWALEHLQSDFWKMETS